MNIELDPKVLHEITLRAIMEMLTPEVREKLVRDAIAHLLSPSQNSWEKGKSPLELAFHRAVEQVAHGFALEFIRTDPTVTTRLKDLVQKTATRVFDQDTDQLALRMADAFMTSLRSER